MRVGIYFDFVKIGHTVFALPFAGSAVALAAKRAGGLRWLDVLGVLLCMVFARAAAMGFNRWADRRFDAENPRTTGRHVPAGLISPAAAAAFTAWCALAFAASTLLFVVSAGNWAPLAWAAPLLAFLCGYSYAKRFTAWAHWWLGIALAGAPVGVWIALRPPGDWLPPFLQAAAIACWVAGFDIIYACQDIDADRRLGLHSVPARLGWRGALRVAAALHAAMFGFLVGLACATPELGGWFRAALVGVAALLAWEHWLARGGDLAGINRAFFNANAAISLTLFAATVADVVRS